MDKNKRLILGIIISIFLVGILLTQINVSDIITTISSISPVYLISGFILYGASYFFRALRFRILLSKKINIKDLFIIVSAHNLVNNILPARTGELSYIYLIKRKDISAGEGISSLIIARIFDFIAISFLFFISIFFIKELPGLVSTILFFVGALLIIVVLSLILLVHYGNKFINFIEKIIQKLNLGKFKIIKLLFKKMEEAIKHFGAIKSKKITIFTFLISLFIWLPLCSMAWVLLEGMGIHLDIPAVVIGMTFTFFSVLFPVQGIASFGTLEGAWVIAFISLGVEKEVAIASGFSFHIIHIIYFFIFGVIGVYLLGYFSKRNNGGSI